MYNLTYFTKKGFKMNVATTKKLLNEAINSGCKTAAELALYLKVYQYQTIIHHNSNAKTVQLLGKKL